MEIDNILIKLKTTKIAYFLKIHREKKLFFLKEKNEIKKRINPDSG